MRHEWESCPNTDIRTLHVDVRLPEVDSIIDGRLKFDRCHDAAFKRTMLRLNHLKGIKQISSRSYELRITKGKVFHWREITSHVVREIEDWAREHSPDYEGDATNANERKPRGVRIRDHHEAEEAQ